MSTSRANTLCPDHEPYVLPDGSALRTCSCERYQDIADGAAELRRLATEQRGDHAEIDHLRHRVEVLQEVVRQQHACWRTGRALWQQGSECEAEFLAAINPTTEDTNP